MKKTMLLLLAVSMLLAAIFATSLTAHAEAGNTVLVFRGKEQSERELSVDVMVEENSGVCAMLLNLEYDTSALTLTGLSYGEAFSALDPIHTGTDTPAGYGVYPFQISYLGEENDTSLGRMMTLHFRVREDAPDGTYTVTFSYERNKDVAYLHDGAILTKNLLIDGARITLSASEILSLETLSAENAAEQASKLWIPILIGGIAAAAVGVGAFALLRKRKKEKKWIKL